MYEYNCDHCGIPFKSKRNDAHYCSDRCRTAYGRKKRKEKELNDLTEKKRINKLNIEITQLESEIIILESQFKSQGLFKVLRSMSLGAKIKELKLKKEELQSHFDMSTDDFYNRFINLTYQLLLAGKNDLENLSEETLRILKEQSPNAFNSANQFNFDTFKVVNILFLTEEYGEVDKEKTKIQLEINEAKIKIKALQRKMNHTFNWESPNPNYSQKEISSQLERKRAQIQEIKDEIANPPKSLPPVQINSQKSISRPAHQRSKRPNKGEIGGADLLNMHFDTFTLSDEIGRFMGELDRNMTAFALTGDSGAGKSYFAFEMGKHFADNGFRVKIFSLEEGLGKLTQDKVRHYEIGNEVTIVGNGTLTDVRSSARHFDCIVVDSFSKLNAKAEEFEKLRSDFPQTLFIMIFQKTTAGTMRGGSSIKYNSSATINVVRRDGQRIAIMEKGRYGTIGWEYSITDCEVIKEY